MTTTMICTCTHSGKADLHIKCPCCGESLLSTTSFTAKAAQHLLNQANAPFIKCLLDTVHRDIVKHCYTNGVLKASNGAHILRWDHFTSNGSSDFGDVFKGRSRDFALDISEKVCEILNKEGYNISVHRVLCATGDVCMILHSLCVSEKILTCPPW
jgi:hypothetical protein